MNIIIDRAEHELLQSRILEQFPMGSHLYGTAHAGSDTDWLCVYATSEAELYSGLPNVHQFQYKDETQHTDWNYCSALQFEKNLCSGESTIHADIILFTNYRDHKLEICRTYKIIKAYLGFAKRDIKQISRENPKKAIHAARGLYCAEQLLQNKLPLLEAIQQCYKTAYDANHLAAKEQELRTQANALYDAGLLHNYYINDYGQALWQKLLDSNNTKAFRY